MNVDSEGILTAMCDCCTDCRIRRIEGKLDRLLALIKPIDKEIKIMNAETQAALKALTDKVTAETTVEAGLATVIDTAVQVINGIPAEIAAAIAAAPSNTDPELLGALSALGDSISASGTTLASKKDELSTALTANTPAAPPPAA